MGFIIVEQWKENSEKLVGVFLSLIICQTDKDIRCMKFCLKYICTNCKCTWNGRC